MAAAPRVGRSAAELRRNSSVASVATTTSITGMPRLTTATSSRILSREGHRRTAITARIEPPMTTPSRLIRTSSVPRRRIRGKLIMPAKASPRLSTCTMSLGATRTRKLVAPLSSRSRFPTAAIEQASAQRIHARRLEPSLWAAR
jgi:hypothetical protein